MKSLIVYNGCGIKRDNTEIYPRYIQRLIDQSYTDDVKLVVSFCKPRSRTIPYLKSLFPDLDYIQIDDGIPVNVTFNNAILKSVEKYGKFDNYTFFTADTLLMQDNSMQTLFDSINNNSHYGMLSAQADIDSCYAYGLKLGGGRFAIDDENARKEMFKDGKDYIVPVGKACAAHVQVYSSKIFDFYGKCCPDIFAGYCTESTFTFVNAALKLNWAISKDVLTHHDAGMDGPSCATDPEKHKQENPATGAYDHAFAMPSLLEIFTNETARKLGLGYEECQEIVMHDPSQFENNVCINEELKYYIKDNLYLSKNKFDYDTINGYYV